MSFIIFKTPRIIYKTTKFFLFYFSQFLQESSKLKIVSILICTSASDSFFASRCLNIALVFGPCLSPPPSSSLVYKQFTNSRDVIEGFCKCRLCRDTRKFISNVFIVFGIVVFWKVSLQSVVFWKVSLQSVVTLSTTQAEYIILTKREMIKELSIVKWCVTIHCNSRSVIHIVDHQIYNERIKHINVKLHSIRYVVEFGEVNIVKVASEENHIYIYIYICEILTKIEIQTLFGGINFLFGNKEWDKKLFHNLK